MTTRPESAAKLPADIKLWRKRTGHVRNPRRVIYGVILCTSTSFVMKLWKCCYASGVNVWFAEQWWINAYFDYPDLQCSSCCKKDFRECFLNLPGLDIHQLQMNIALYAWVAARKVSMHSLRKYCCWRHVDIEGSKLLPHYWVIWWWTWDR